MKLRGLFIIALAAALDGQQISRDWPQLLGPARNGVYTGPIAAKGPIASLWKRPAGEGFSAPVLAQGRLILFHREGDKEIVESLDPATGKTQWATPYPTGYRDDFGFSNGPRATPTVDGDIVYTYGAEGTLAATRLDTGAKLWSLDARQQFGIRKEFFGAANSPVVEGDRLLMNIGGANGAGIVAIHKATGKTLWKALTHESGYSSPVVATIGKERHALFFTREGLVDADPATGRVRFFEKWRARMAASVNAAIPLVAGDEVFISASYDTGAALLRISGDTVKTVWSGDDSLSNHYATAVYKDGYLYGFHGRQEYGQSLRCIEWKTGKVAWNADGAGAGTVTLAGPYLLVLKENGEVLVGPASPKGFQPERKARVSNGTVRAYPALAAGRLYVRSERELSAWKID